MLEVKRCGDCEKPYFGFKRSRYCSDPCKQKAKEKRRRADPERLERARARAAKSKEAYRERHQITLKYEGDPDWRKRPRAQAPSSETPEERDQRVRETRRRAKLRRRARKAETQVLPITQTMLDGKFEYWGSKCWMCGASEDLTVDHVKPLSKGGPHILSNLRPACMSCNAWKHNKWPGVNAINALRRDEER